MRQKDFLGALNLCMNTSGLEDKEIYMALDIDPGHFSNIRKGKPGANFPPNKLNTLMDLCGNEIPLTWLAHSRGKGLVMLESEAQRQLREANEALARERDKTRMLADLLAGRAA